MTFSLAILFSTLPAIHSSSVAALISYGEVVRRSQDVPGLEEPQERSTSHHHVWVSTEWQRVFLHFLQSALLV